MRELTSEDAALECEKFDAELNCFTKAHTNICMKYWAAKAKAEKNPAAARKNPATPTPSQIWRLRKSMATEYSHISFVHVTLC